jgi:hypothetical protein
MMQYRFVPGILLLWWSPSICSFQELHRFQRSEVFLNSHAGDSNAGPTFPPSSFTPQSPSEQVTDTAESQSDGQANTRFSAFAPDPNLDTADFRLQLRENMKADLERRRNEDPNRGNQIAKNYLDSL